MTRCPGRCARLCRARRKRPWRLPPRPGRSPFTGVREAPLPYALAAGASRSNAAPDRAEIFTMPVGSENAQTGFFSSMQVLGQILGCYLVCASPSGLALIDQHAAHERVAFEQLRRQLDAGKVEMQSLLIPQTVELSAGEMMLLEQKLEVMRTFRLSARALRSGCLRHHGCSRALARRRITAEIVRQMVAELAEVDTSAKLRQHLEDRLATIACHSVIRAHRKLEPHEMRALLEALDRIDFATQCPHGRPVLVEWSQAELERIFQAASSSVPEPARAAAVISNETQARHHSRPDGGRARASGARIGGRAQWRDHQRRLPAGVSLHGYRHREAVAQPSKRVSSII